MQGVPLGNRPQTRMETSFLENTDINACNYRHFFRLSPKCCSVPSEDKVMNLLKEHMMNLVSVLYQGKKAIGKQSLYKPITDGMLR